MSETFRLPDGDYDHLVGDPDCDAGWCNGRDGGYPHPCTEGCPGLVHANFGDEKCDGDYWLYELCDVEDREPS